jgi:hypothetical protein
MAGGASRRLLADLVLAAENTIVGTLQRHHVGTATLPEVTFPFRLLDRFELAAPVAPDAADAKEDGDADGDKDSDLEGEAGQL